MSNHTDTTTRISNPSAPATDRQINLVRHLAAQFYSPDQVDHVVRTLAATKGDASNCIERLLAAGGTKPAPARKAPAARPAARPTNNRASRKQVDLIMRLISQSAWHDSDAGQGFDAPSRSQVERMTSRDASALIDDLRGR